MSDIIPGDVVAVNVQSVGRREGLVIGQHIDYAGRIILEVQFEPGDYYHAWYPTVTRIRRTTYIHPPQPRTRTIEKHVYYN
ncbi:hypothetical protein BS47DRAFT_1340414 [Hydnum rufescens UP504]|uniref:Uncharacterized protein n=1 Tax=Hydnum rufescens UP504 TaxID=1448309 RepID=A0A9P6B307_9AGAM|nr:hypothetical protein BS47DRAFT_1340414 [Hydnum rufescens UP504]